MPVDIVWFKKDLQVQDHQPLREAAKSDNNPYAYSLVEPKSRLEDGLTISNGN